MRGEPKEPPVPVEMDITIRRNILLALQEAPCSIRDISGKLRIPEKQVYGHLEHIRKTVSATGKRFLVNPAQCATCGFSFKKRDRLTKPSKCPVCRGESIRGPLYFIESRDSQSPGSGRGIRS